MKLEVGMYVRTPYGIRKIMNIKKDEGYGKPRVKVITLDELLHTIFKLDYIFYTDEKIIKECKASHNIKDLIKVGDFVNGLRVYGITDYGLEVYMFGDCKELLEEKEIESIVTKEQFESMSYKIGD